MKMNERLSASFSRKLRMESNLTFKFLLDYEGFKKYLAEDIDVQTLHNVCMSRHTLLYGVRRRDLLQVSTRSQGRSTGMSKLSGTTTLTLQNTRVSMLESTYLPPHQINNLRLSIAPAKLIDMGVDVQTVVLDIGNFKFVVDNYLGGNQALVLANITVPIGMRKAKVALPDFFFRDVSHEYGYTLSNIIQAPFIDLSGSGGLFTEFVGQPTAQNTVVENTSGIADTVAGVHLSLLGDPPLRIKVGGMIQFGRGELEKAMEFPYDERLAENKTPTNDSSTVARMTRERLDEQQPNTRVSHAVGGIVKEKMELAQIQFEKEQGEIVLQSLLDKLALEPHLGKSGIKPSELAEALKIPGATERLLAVIHADDKDALDTPQVLDTPDLGEAISQNITAQMESAPNVPPSKEFHKYTPIVEFPEEDNPSVQTLRFLAASGMSDAEAAASMLADELSFLHTGEDEVSDLGDIETTRPPVNYDDVKSLLTEIREGSSMEDKLKEIWQVDSPEDIDTSLGFSNGAHKDVDLEIDASTVTGDVDGLSLRRIPTKIYTLDDSKKDTTKRGPTRKGFSLASVDRNEFPLPTENPRGTLVDKTIVEETPKELLTWWQRAMDRWL